MFRTDLLSIIRCLDTVFTEIGICHTEILKWVKLLVCVCVCIYIYIYICVCLCVCVCALSLNRKTYVVSKILLYNSFNTVSRLLMMDSKSTRNM
jgi:hypothetical protein